MRFCGNNVSMTVPDYGVIELTAGVDGVEMVLPTDEVPSWINASNNRVAITTPNGRLQVTKSKSEVFRYAFGWELFLFTLDSPFHGRPFAGLLALSVSGDEVVAGRSNLAAMVSDVWTNKMWRHGDVAWALFAKLFAEAIENVERKPIESVRASGGTAVHTMRLGVFPQVFPVMMSHVLYFESNTRSATILGIVGAGGIGLQLSDRIRINNWDEAAFIILMILVTVALIDNLSHRIRMTIINADPKAK